MNTVIYKKTCYDGSCLDDSSHYCQFLRFSTLPFIPHTGMTISDASFLEKIESILWDNANQHFVLTCENSFLQSSSKINFEGSLEFELQLGWDEKHEIYPLNN